VAILAALPTMQARCLHHHIRGNLKSQGIESLRA
jgi:hypothetical protein